MRFRFLAALTCMVIVAVGCKQRVAIPDEKPMPAEKANLDAKDGKEVLKTPTEERSVASDSEQEAVRHVEKLGGKVDIRPSDSGNRVTKIDLNSTKATDDDLKLLGLLTALESLDLGKTKITDAGLAHLKELKNLRSLNLAFDDVTDAGLVHLKGLTKLESLYLVFTKVTKKGTDELKTALPNLSISR